MDDVVRWVYFRRLVYGEDLNLYVGLDSQGEVCLYERWCKGEVPLIEYLNNPEVLGG